MSLNIMVTGSPRRVTERQMRTLRAVLETIDAAAPAVTLHHGDCIGADDHAAALVREGFPAWGITAHPGHNAAGLSPYRAYAGADLYEPPAPYAVRNRAMVTTAALVIALPHGPEHAPGGGQVPYSGEWSTVRQARKHHKPVVIIWP